MEYTCHFDGSYRNHKGVEDMGVGCVILDSNKNTVFELAFHLPDETGSTNLAEYSACVEILKWLKGRQFDRATIRGDSKLVANQLNGHWAIKKGVYTDKAKEAVELFNSLPNVSIKWTSRNNNVRADELSKMGLNGQNFIVNE